MVVMGLLDVDNEDSASDDVERRWGLRVSWERRGEVRGQRVESRRESLI